MIRVLLHCLFHLHLPARWRDDWLRPHWYCQTCFPKRRRQWPIQ